MSTSFDYYKIFYQVAIHQNITLAAESLFLSQPTVSRCIQSLENDLGCRLFIRSKKGVLLTAEGALLFEHISKACQHIFTAEAELKSLRAMAGGAVRLGASEMTLRYYLLPYLKQFHETYPSVQFRIRSFTTPDAVAALKAGELDLAVIISPIPQDDDLEISYLQEFQDIAAAGSAFSQLKGQTLDLADLLSFPLICMEADTATRQFWDRQFSAAGLTLKADMELPTTDLLCPLAEENLGIALVPENFARDSFAKGRLFRLNLRQTIPVRRICAVQSKKRPPSLPGKAFLEVCASPERTLKKGITP